MPEIDSVVPPPEIIQAVRMIEEWTTQRTTRNDWVMGRIGCRKGMEQLMRDNAKLKDENEQLKKRLGNQKNAGLS